MKDMKKDRVRPLMWHDMPDDRGRGEGEKGGDEYESQWWRNNESSGLQKGEIREKDGQVWVTVLQVNAAVKATAALSDGSKPPGTPFSISPLPPYRLPNDSSTTYSPPCLRYDSHPLPELNYCRGPSESSITLPPPSVIIKQVYELRPAPDCIEEPSSAVFTRLRTFVRTLETHTPLPLMAL